MPYQAERTISINGFAAITISGIGTDRVYVQHQIAYPTIQQRDQTFDDLDAEKLNDLMVRAGYPPALIETFLDFGDMAFDARDVLAVEKRTTARMTGGGAEVPAVHLLDVWVSRTGGSEALRLILNYGEANTADRHRDYGRIVAAMKASRA